MKKVLIFSLNYYPFVGGAEVAIKELTDRLPSTEYEFHLLAPRYDSTLPKKERHGQITVHRFGLARPHASISDQSSFPLKLNKYWYQIAAAHYAHRLHREHHFDLVWGMMAHATGIPAGIFKRKHPDVKYLLTLQEGDPSEYIENLMKPVWPLFRQAFTAADALQTISTHLLAWGKRMGCTGISSVIPNGVDTQAFTSRSSETERDEMKKRLGIQEGDVTLITTSRLVHKNGIDDVLQALTNLPKQVTFVICGIGPDEEKLRALTLHLNLQSRVRFVGQLAHHELPTALQVSDMFIRPSRSEGMGNSFIEAMAAGIPVVATQEGGISDFLYDEHRNPTHDTTGWAVNKDTPADIVRAVTDIMERPEKVEEVIRTARAMVLTQYDWDLIATRMNEFINSVLALKTPTP